MAKTQDPLGDPAFMAFPLNGVDAEQPFDLQPQGTAPDAMNVCAVDPSTNRARGGSRPGLGRFLPPLPTGSAIQHLQLIVDPQAEALTADFGELPFGSLIQFEWVDDPTTGISQGRPRNLGQVPRGGSGRETGFSINKTPTKIIWADPADMAQGDALGSTQLNATAATVELSLPVTGTFQYSPPAGTVLGTGKATLMVVFTPSNPTLYKGCIGQVEVKVAPGPKTVTLNWSNPASITTPTPLSSTQLNATATAQGVGDVPGTFTYTPPAGTVLLEGNGQVLSVSFLPDDTGAFTTPPDKTVLINVTAAHPDVPTINVRLAGIGSIGPGDVVVDEVPGPPNNDDADLTLAESLVGLPEEVFLLDVFFNEGLYVGVAWNWDEMRWEF